MAKAVMSMATAEVSNAAKSRLVLSVLRFLNISVWLKINQLNKTEK